MKISQLLEYQKARETKAFRSWFGNSKVVDSNGNPLVVYRGTRKRPAATEFKMTQGRAVPSFTNDPAAASVYARQLDTRQYGSGSTVVAAYLRIVKPLDLTRYNETISLIDFINLLPSDLNVPDGGSRKLGWRDVSYMIYDLDEVIYKTGARFSINVYDDDGFKIKGFRDLSDAIDSWGEADDISSIEDALDNVVIDTYTIADSEDIVSYLQKVGYDGVILKDVFESGARHYEPQGGKELELGAEGTPIILTYRPFEQYQIKSIYNIGTFGKDEPDITKEEKDNIIELEEGREENLRAWFGNSKVVDTNGLPMIVYHGTANDFSTFKNLYRDFGIHFGNREAANEFAKYSGARVIPVFLKITNPFTMPDIFGPDEEHLRQVMNFLYKKKIINLKRTMDLDAIRRDRDMYWDDRKATIYAELARSLFDAGYDGIQYRNTNEGKRTLRPDERINFVIKKEGLKYVAYLPDNIMPTAPLGDGNTPEEAEKEAYEYLQQQASYIDMSYIIFNSSQVKSAFGTEYDPSDPRYTKEDARNPKYLSGTDKVANISPVLGAKPKKQKALMNKFFGSS